MFINHKRNRGRGKTYLLLVLNGVFKVIDHQIRKRTLNPYISFQFQVYFSKFPISTCSFLCFIANLSEVNFRNNLLCFIMFLTEQERDFQWMIKSLFFRNFLDFFPFKLFDLKPLYATLFDNRIIGKNKQQVILSILSSF